MAVKPYRDITKGVMTLDGIGCSETFKVLNSRWGNVLSAIPTIATLRWTLGPTIEANYGTQYPQRKEDIIKPSSHTPSSMALCYWGASNPGAANSTFYGNGTQTNTGNGRVLPISGQTFANNTSGHYVIGNFDRARFILVCQVTTRNLTGTTWAGTWGDYVNKSETFPYIIGVSYGCYYKQDLSSGSQGVTRGISYQTEMSKHVWNVGRRNDNRAAEYQYDGYITTSTWSMLSGMPILLNRIVNVQGARIYASYLNETFAINHVPYNLIHFMPGALDTDNDHVPFFYMYPSDVVTYMNSMGLWWADSQAAIADCHGEATVSPHIHVPQVDDNGFPTGEMFSGEEIADNYVNGGDLNIYNPLGGTDFTGNNTNPENDPLKSPYEDVQEPDPLEPGDEDLELENSDYNGVGLFGTYYATTRAGIKAFCDGLWNDDGSVIDQIITGLKLLADPIDGVISLRLYPFRVSSYAQTEGYKPVYIGTYRMGDLTMNRISESSSIILDLGQIMLRPKYNNFLDLAPYTAMTLYIPFVGCIQLNPNDYLGETLRVQMTVDMTTGQCVAAVYASEAPLVYASGQMGVDIPVTCKTGSQLAAAITTATAGLAIGALGNMVGVASKAGFMRSLATKTAAATADRMEHNASIDRAVGAMDEVSEIAMDTAMLYFGATSMDRTGTNSPANGMTMPICCFLTISRPTIEMPDDYNHTYGKVCHVSSSLSSFIGFTVCANVDTTGISATEQERSAIKAFLESGVYV